ncbi:sulfite exporter TauE/SafE family protein [Aquimarina sp. 2-A2]|uniref:sulfite exporter TauE/SafE family protein n=1 Tax=Aquimarina sp. 2-A2 TaxID=3382644 RepID=UPI00387F1707
MISEVNDLWVFIGILPIIAFLYAGVGHGGASGYLALMSIFSVTPEMMKPTALLLNLFVAGTSFFYYYKGGFFNKNLFFYFAITSIPMAYLGGLIELDATIYKRILGVLLIFAVLKMLNVFGKESEILHKIKLWQGLVVGAVIGFFSGLIGIGGGIILTPIILLFHWGKMKEAAAVSALFIWVNSIAGLAGQLTNGVVLSSQSFLMVGVAVVGGFLGSYYGSKRMSNKMVRYMLSIVLITASLKLIFIE